MSFPRRVFCRSVFFLAAITALTCLSAGPSPAQSPEDPPVEWGNIPAADLAMKSYPADTSAAAVILCDYGEVSMDNDLGLIFSRHVRAKILTKAGYEWGTFELSLYTRDREEKISDVEGVTYNLKPDGQVEKSELDDDSIFEEEYDDKYTRYKFTLPALQPGCVIDVRYKITQKHILAMPDWTFEKSIPVLWSEYRVVVPVCFAYAAVRQGYQSFHINEMTEVTRHFSGYTAGYIREAIAKCRQYRWALRNVPALREEPFITTTDDYAQRVSLQLAAYAAPGAGVQRVLKSWEQVVEELQDIREENVNVTGDVRRATEPLIASLATPEEKLAAIYDYVRTSIVWTGEHRVFTEKDVDDVLESRKGSSAEITTLLLSMLECAGLDACPVIVSTRSNGRIQDVYPILSQFNYVLACVKLGKERRFLDATDRYRSMDLLPTKVLNTRGLLIKEGPVEWVTLTTGGQYQHRYSGLLALGADGEITGSVENVSEGYAAIARRQELQEKKENEVARSLIGADRVSVTVDSVSVKGKEAADTALTMTMQLSSPSYAQASGEMIYLNPFVVGRQHESPFKLPVRAFPVDMMYPRKVTWSLQITIPEGYEVREGTGEKGSRVGQEALFTKTCSVNGRTVTLNAEFAIARPEFQAKSYGALKTFYEKVAVLQAEQIVLGRRTTTAQKGAK